MFQVSLNSIQNIWVIIRKQNFNQNFNPRPPNQRQSISRNFSFKNPAKNQSSNLVLANKSELATAVAMSVWAFAAQAECWVFWFPAATNLSR